MPGPNDNTGTTPQGSEPQGNEGTGDNNQNPGGNPPRLIAGKFRTVEEAVEQGYAGLERGYHQLGEQVGALTRLMEQALTPVGSNPGGVPIGSGGAGRGDDYGRRSNPDDVDAAAFLTDPNKIFREREERLLGRVGDLVGNVVANAMAVNEFKSRNPDLIPHERIVQTFMRDLDPRRGTVAERLNQAGQMARQYLNSVRTGHSGMPNQVPTGNDYVEPPRGGGFIPPGAPPEAPSANQMSAEEKELLDYIAERNANLNANFGIKEQK